MRDLQIPGLISDNQFRPPDADSQCVDIHVRGAMILDRASRNPSKR